MTLVPPPAGRVVAWVITYPIIWNDSAKEQIHKAARDAGMPRCVSTICLNLDGVRITMIIEHNHSYLFALTDPLLYSDDVKLLPEPDAAALWGTRNEPVDLYGRDMLVDNGGGTTDIACFQKGQT